MVTRATPSINKNRALHPKIDIQIMEKCGFRMGGVHFLGMSNQYHEQPIQKPTKILW